MRLSLILVEPRNRGKVLLIYGKGFSSEVTVGKEYERKTFRCTHCTIKKVLRL